MTRTSDHASAGIGRRGTRRGDDRRRRHRRAASGESVEPHVPEPRLPGDRPSPPTDEIVAAWNEANPDIQVELRQGSWDNVHDELVTQFAGGTAPDIIHDESADIIGFAEQGYLADLTPYLSEDADGRRPRGRLAGRHHADGAIVAAPTLMQSYVVFANVDAFEAAGVEVPTGETLAWDDFEALAAELTTDDGYGLGWGLRSPTATIMNLALGFGGDFFTVDGEDVTFEAGDAEMEVPRRIHDLAYEAGGARPVSLTLSGSDTLPGFIGGDYAMYVGGNFIAQQLVDSAPEDFNWVVLPPLAGTEGANQAANPQTLSVAAESEHVEEAAAFINYFMEAENLAAVAEGDWLIPHVGRRPRRGARVDRRRERLGRDPGHRRAARRRPVPVGRRLPAVAGADRHAGVPAVPRRPDQPRRPASPAHRRAGSRSPAVDSFPRHRPAAGDSGTRRAAGRPGEPMDTCSGPRPRRARRRGRRRRPRRRRRGQRPRRHPGPLRRVHRPASSRRSTRTGATPGRSPRTTRATGTSPTTR